MLAALVDFQIQADLRDDYHIRLSHDALGKYVQRYQVMLAARQQDPEVCGGNTKPSMR